MTTHSINDCIQLANLARSDKTLIANHIANGQPAKIQKNILDLHGLLTVIEGYDYCTASIKADIGELEKAAKVYL